jgi:hypothetical protein
MSLFNRILMTSEATVAGFHLKFQRELCRLSRYEYNKNNYDLAKTEWKVNAIDQCHGGGQCICGHYIAINVRIFNEKWGTTATIGIDCSAHIAKEMKKTALKIKTYCQKIADDLTIRPTPVEMETLQIVKMITLDDVNAFEVDKNQVTLNSKILRNYYKDNEILDHYGTCQCGNLYFKESSIEIREECTSCVIRRQRKEDQTRRTREQERQALEQRKEQERRELEQKKEQERRELEQKKEQERRALELKKEQERRALERKKAKERRALELEKEKRRQELLEIERERIALENAKKRQEQMALEKEKQRIKNQQMLAMKKKLDLEKEQQIREDEEHERKQKQIRLEQLEVGRRLKNERILAEQISY